MKNQVHWIVAIVAIVAVVGLMSGFSGCTAKEGGDLTGQAREAIRINKDLWNYVDGDLSPRAISLQDKIRITEDYVHFKDINSDNILANDLDVDDLNVLSELDLNGNDIVDVGEINGENLNVNGLTFERTPYGTLGDDIIYIRISAEEDIYALIFRPEFADLILQPHSGDVQLSPSHGEVIIDLDQSNGYGMKIQGLPDINSTSGMYLCISEAGEIFKSSNSCQ